MKERLESGKYPPFPREMPSLFSDGIAFDRLLYRKHVWNINKDEIILEPGQDPARNGFIEPRQFSTDLIVDELYLKHDNQGIVFSDEETVFGISSKSKNLVGFND